MADFSKAFSVSEGISLGEDEVGVIYSIDNPSLVGQVAPVGTILLRTNGILYQKIGTLDTDWIERVNRFCLNFFLSDGTPAPIDLVDKSLIFRTITPIDINQLIHPTDELIPFKDSAGNDKNIAPIVCQ